MWFPMSDFGDLGVVGELVLPIFLKYGPCTKASLGSRDTVPRAEAVGMFFMLGGHFQIEILT